MAEDLGERTEMPTGRRLSEARQEGNVARSTDLGSAILLVGAVILLAAFGGGLVDALAGVMRQALGDGGGAAQIAPDGAHALSTAALAQVAIRYGPVLLGLALVAYASQVVQIGWLFTTRPLVPKANRLNIVANIGRLFGRRGVARLVADVAKLAAVSLVSWLLISRAAGRLATLPGLEVKAAVLAVAHLAVELALWILLLLVVIGVADWVYQRWQHTRELRMTKQEVKDERRSMEGDPAMKRRRFQMMREIATQRIHQTVPTADVIVTNPTHFSVAIKYDSGTMAAPRVVAKGADHMALRIRHLALLNDVPLVERPPLARALYYGVDVGREIPPEHYQAVAELLAYVYRVQQKAA